MQLGTKPFFVLSLHIQWCTSLGYLGLALFGAVSVYPFYTLRAFVGAWASASQLCYYRGSSSAPNMSLSGPASLPWSLKLGSTKGKVSPATQYVSFTQPISSTITWITAWDCAENEILLHVKPTKSIVLLTLEKIIYERKIQTPHSKLLYGDFFRSRVSKLCT